MVVDGTEGVNEMLEGMRVRDKVWGRRKMDIRCKGV